VPGLGSPTTTVPGRFSSRSKLRAPIVTATVEASLTTSRSFELRTMRTLGAVVSVVNGTP